jgi:hypothetical protein
MKFSHLSYELSKRQLYNNRSLSKIRIKKKEREKKQNRERSNEKRRRSAMSTSSNKQKSDYGSAQSTSYALIRSLGGHNPDAVAAPQPPFRAKEQIEIMRPPLLLF